MIDAGARQIVNLSSRVLAVVLIITLWSAQDLSAGCTKKACFEQTRFLDGFTAFVLDATATPTDQKSAEQYIWQHGGVVALEFPRLLLGWIDLKTSRQLLVGHQKIVHVTSGPLVSDDLPPVAVPFDQKNLRAGFNFYNFVISGRLASWIDADSDMPLPTMGHDALAPPTRVLPPGTAFTSRAISGSHSPFILSSQNTVGPPWTFNVMSGRVRLELHMLESTGAIDPNFYTWTWAEQDDVMNSMMFAGSLWSNQAAARGVSLTFVWGGEYETYNPHCQISYEPVIRKHTDDYLWVNEVLTKLDSNLYPYDEGLKRPGGWGVVNPTPSAVFQAMETYNAADAAANGVDYSFPMFVANNTNGPTTFADGMRSYTYVGGPYSQLLYYNGGDPSQLYKVVRHETGHIFYACDEYVGGCSGCDAYCVTYGPSVGTRNGIVRCRWAAIAYRM